MIENDIYMIVALDRSNGIGGSGNLVWHYKEDLKHFQKETTGQILIVGHETYKSLPVLRDRTIIVLTSDIRKVKLKDKNHVAVNTVEHALIVASDLGDDKGIYIAGGAKIYKLFEDYCNYFVVTYIDRDHEGIDTYYYLPNDKIEIYDNKILVDGLLYVNYYRLKSDRL